MFDFRLFLAYLLLYGIVFLFGAAMASFLNVVAYRVPRGESFAKGRSHCTSCGKTLTPRDLVPVLSWLLLGGKCRHCGAAISPRYVLVELMGGLLAVWTVKGYGFTPLSLAVLCMLAALHLIAFVDWDTMTIPDVFQLVLLLPSAALAFLLPNGTLLTHLIGAAAVSLPILLLFWMIPGSFGSGDIILLAICGLALGWRLALFALFCAILTAGSYAIFLLAVKAKEKQAHIPFGPFIALGTAAALLFGEAALRWYLGFFR